MPELLLRRQIKAILPDFDVVLIDTPPAMRAATVNALVVADTVSRPNRQFVVRPARDERRAISVSNWVPYPALFMASCPATVVSQWDVEATSTAKLMVEFHMALLSANHNSERLRGSAEALRQAALKLLKTPGYNHPFYWAAFSVVGSGW